MISRALIASLALLISAAFAETTDYAYDETGRLVRADYTGGAAIAYAYDANGNLLNRLTTSPAGTNYVMSTIWSAGGHITPTNPVVAAGASQTLSIIASNGYVLADVLVNNVSVGPATTYTLDNVRGSQSIHALFQPADGCRYAVTPATTNCGKNAGNGYVSLATDAACAWTTETSEEWLRVAPASGFGSALVVFALAENSSGTTRTGTVHVAGQAVRVIQHATIDPPSPPPPFRFEEMRKIDDQLVVTLGWPTLPDARYSLSWSTNLLLPFSILATNMAPGDEGRLYFSATNPISMNNVFYLMEAE